VQSKHISCTGQHGGTITQYRTPHRAQLRLILAMPSFSTTVS